MVIDGLPRQLFQR